MDSLRIIIIIIIIIIIAIKDLFRIKKRSRNNRVLPHLRSNILIRHSFLKKIRLLFQLQI